MSYTHRRVFFNLLLFTSLTVHLRACKSAAVPPETAATTIASESCMMSVSRSNVWQIFLLSRLCVRSSVFIVCVCGCE